MYVHLGGDVVVRVRDVIAIVDLAATQRRGLSVADIIGGRGSPQGVTRVGDGAGTSLVVTSDHLYISPISPLTLRRRAQAPWAAEREDEGTPLLSPRRRRKGPKRARRRL
ncbi:hypothetical protein U7230_13710 [Carboxydochorda subterranea]|uniref:DUF370 domain-containing protein n=1 Tax=Carboxydichorda subterranea TaxID=3109565 RepID=A0ABZ1BWE6_9FIRM|nr:hypothetical protein [Limnochorda sp. L945t]WRP17125.1 hypothetical protein U7230_13710 [Limnochorda sp. L945t]